MIDMKDELVSIIVPIYNVADYLERCIESILQQTYRDIEIILVDDGSTDESSNICEDYKEKDSRIVVIHKKNEGLVKARKSGLFASNGDYILNVDGDDWIVSDMCETLLEKALETDADVVDSGFLEVIDNECKEHVCEKASFFLDRDGTAVDLLQCWLENPLNRRVHSTIWSKLFKKQVFERIYSGIAEDDSYGEDMLSFIEMLNHAHSLVVVDKCFYYYEIRNDSLSHVCDFDMFFKYIELDIHIYRRILELYPDISIDVLNNWYMNRKRYILDAYDAASLVQRCVYLIPQEKMISGAIILYGAGKVGNDYYRQLSIYKDVNIVAWVDKHSEKYDYAYCRVDKPSECIGSNYDYLLIAVADKDLSNSIKTELIDKGFDSEKIVWIEPQKRIIRIY